MPQIDIRQVDITQLDVDAIVNAANDRLAGGGGVDGAIHAAAGPCLMEACKALGGCPTGEAKATQGFELKARWVIHAVGPVWRGGGEGEPTQLACAYRSALSEAARVGARRVAFPAISAGTYGYPLRDAALIALTVVTGWLAVNPQPYQVVLCAYSPEVDAVYRELAEALLGPGAPASS